MGTPNESVMALCGADETSAGSIASRSCKQRKDGAPSIVMHEQNPDGRWKQFRGRSFAPPEERLRSGWRRYGLLHPSFFFKNLSRP